MLRTCPKCGGTGKIRDDKSIGLELVKLRTKANLTATAVADQMGYTRSYLCDLEHARRSWTPELEKRYKEAINKLLG